MTPSRFDWQAHRFVADRLGWQRPFGRGRRAKRLLLISEADPISTAQIFPFWYHRADLRGLHRIEVRELPLRRFLARKGAFEHVDAVCFQTWFDLSADAMLELVARLRSAYPSAALAYLDWFAPADLRYAEVLDQHVVAYAKKQVYRDPARYGETTLGDTNLTDYYSRRFKLDDYPPTRFNVPAGFGSKLWLSPHFAFTAGLVEQFLQPVPQADRDIDVHARMAVNGTPWYTCMRREALEHAERLAARLDVKCRGRVSRDEYARELYRSKLCFSPFGYGEVCWRDFEAMAAGSVVLKPDMSHLTCFPEAFVPFETYVPVAWDLSDFEDKVDYYLAHGKEREAIARNAFEKIGRFFRERQFVAHLAELMKRLRLVD